MTLSGSTIYSSVLETLVFTDLIMARKSANMVLSDSYDFIARCKCTAGT